MLRATLTLLMLALATPFGLAAPATTQVTTATARVATCIVPYEQAQPATPEQPLDKLVRAGLAQHGLAPAFASSDAVFMRRVYLDVIGRLPEASAVREFLRDPQPDKRARLIDALLAREEFNDYWAMKWCDRLRVKSEFPVNLWPNAVQAYHQWIHAAMRQNMPLDQFARTLLTANGSNFRVGPANFFRAVDARNPETFAAAAAQTFMGVRLETWPPADRAAMSVFFSRIGFKRTNEWKEEIVFSDVRATATLAARYPDEQTVTLRPGDDPRVLFADWLVAPGNPWFARNLANRTWAELFGRGIVHEPDDLRADNPPANPALLDTLASELVRLKYDQRALLRLILNSQTYQQSSLPRQNSPDNAAQFACYPARRIEAEVLLDAICQVTGTGAIYTSMIPEPYTVIRDQPAVAVADGSISSPFLELFGRPARDTGRFAERINAPTSAQCMYLMNGSDLQKRIESGKGVRALLGDARGGSARVIRAAYLSALSRMPTAAEEAAAAQYFSQAPGNPRTALDDLMWALLNSSEFLFRH